MPLVDRLRSGDLVIDLRRAPPAEVASGAFIDGLLDELERFGPVRSSRIWVLPEIARDWLDQPPLLAELLFQMVQARSLCTPERVGATGLDMAILASRHPRDPVLVDILQATGLEVWSTLPGGGLPLDMAALPAGGFGTAMRGQAHAGSDETPLLDLFAAWGRANEMPEPDPLLVESIADEVEGWIVRRVARG
jgi:hypothetical protein